MFKEPIGSTPLTSRIADSVFSKINGEGYLGDWSFLATLRALVYPRMGDTDDSVYLIFTSTSHSKEVIQNNTVQTVMDSICYGGMDKGVIQVHNFRNRAKEANDANIEFVRKHFLECHDGWYQIDKVSDFFRKHIDVVCFIQPNEKKVALFCSDMDMKAIHYLQCGIPVYMPWYFSKEEQRVTEEELEILDSLRMKTSEKYVKCIERVAEKYDFEREKIRRHLKGYETVFERAEIEDKKQEISNLISHIEMARNSLMNYIRQKRDVETAILGLEARIAQEESADSELMEYFMSNKRLFLEGVEGTLIKFAVKDYIEFYDPEMAEKMIEKKESYIYRPDGIDGNARIAHNDMKMLMKAIFLEQKLKLKVCAAYRIDPRGSFSGIGHFNFDYHFNDATPNSHIQAYECLGSYEVAISEMLSRNDYIGAIGQCIASCKSINFGDSWVMNDFMSGLYGFKSDGRNIKCIEAPDGTVMTPTEAIMYLRKESEENE